MKSETEKQEEYAVRAKERKENKNILSFHMFISNYEDKKEKWSGLL